MGLPQALLNTKFLYLLQDTNDITTVYMFEVGAKISFSCHIVPDKMFNLQLW